MNQILITEKLYVTPELKRKKKVYKMSFIISVMVIIFLCIYYFYTEYDRNRESDISQDILEGINIALEDEEEILCSSEYDNVWKIIVETTESAEQRITENNSTHENNQQVTNEKETTENKLNYIEYKASNGKIYKAIGRITIDKINVDEAILAQANGDELVQQLKVAPSKFWGPEPNEIGNLCIAGHNYRNKRFFSKVPNLKKGDIIKITDITGRTVSYSVYDKYTVDPENTDCLDQNTDNKKIVTLITCTNDSKKRVIVKAREV